MATVGTDGRFVPLPPVRKRFMDYVEFDTNGGCWLFKGATNGDGYGQNKNADGKREMMHRISFEIHNGPIPDGLCVLHKCDVRACVNPQHLFLGDKRDNAIDAVQKGRWVNNRGERHGMSKLTDSAVVQIKEMLAQSSMTQREIAAVFGVDPSTISDIKRGKRRPM
jgi:DNA-binding XRE family transcriptional regulator